MKKIRIGLIGTGGICNAAHIPSYLENCMDDCEITAICDIDPKALEIAKINAHRAGVGDKLSFSLCDVADFRPMTEKGTLICNPPYGERLLELSECEKIYAAMGKAFERKHGWSYSIISPDEEFEKAFGRKADKRRKLYNGMIKCQLYMYFK